MFSFQYRDNDGINQAVFLNAFSFPGEGRVGTKEAARGLCLHRACARAGTWRYGTAGNRNELARGRNGLHEIYIFDNASLFLVFPQDIFKTSDVINFN
ncbi:MAG: hypothetical protein ACKV2V_16790 [Blastocatellia bacterium]